MVINLELTLEQCNYLYGLLDKDLRAQGLKALTTVVDLHNCVTQAVQEAQGELELGAADTPSETEEDTEASPE